MGKKAKLTRLRICILCKQTLDTTSAGIKDHFKTCTKREVKDNG